MFKIEIDSYYGEPKAYEINNLEEMKSLLDKYNLNNNEFINGLHNPRILADKFVKRISQSHITAYITDPDDNDDIYDPHYNKQEKPKTISNIMDLKQILEAPDDDTEEVEIPEHLVLQHSVNR